MWQLLAVSCLLCLAQADRILQTRISDDGLQREIEPELPIMHQKEVDTLPFSLQEESVLVPRGKRPESKCKGKRPCGGQAPMRENLAEFPPGRPTENNIDNICLSSRVKSNYGMHNLPRSGFGHLSRQGETINQMEAGFSECCLQTEKLSCAQEVWHNELQQFCDQEFSIKTRPYFCCKEDDSARYSCFEKEAPYPSYDSLNPRASPDMDVADTPVLKIASNANLCSAAGSSATSECQRMNLHGASGKKLPYISFPPGEPMVDSIQNICRLRKFRSTYPSSVIPRSSFGWFQRQAKAINQLEAQFKKCCKNEDISCAHEAWEKVLDQFCTDEVGVKTSHHECCKKESSADTYSCFSSSAPHPNYDREIHTLNLGDMQEPTLQHLCGDMKILSKQKQIPLLVKGITETCCLLSSEDRVACAEQEKDKFIETLCTTNRSSWKDTQKCCNQQDRGSCFNINYLAKVSIAAASMEVGGN
ncbi:extracellular matrix protein 1 [Rhinatrema bivittatum]|uniref:extracellular matrix protein 1 n=1 Tax=Rhinatrema bivittatum TaxID=194408 RepID=UPI00112B51AB|nr:extracellular matrix protein 1 [Rhinatrema bivittatum]